MSDQPEALYLAGMIDSDFDPDWMAEEGYDRIARELRRLHAENEALLAATGGSCVLEAIGIIRGTIADLDRLTTLRPWKEHKEGELALWWHDGECIGKSSTHFLREGCRWTPIPEPKEPTK